ncbi:uncharacterized protein BDZ99DRAFT_495771 [Mytilinidion resinicola]|uniref:C2H2-type domain-containing protein n=1 Tax=Mytilinidion resinicola TaxID=574789 RepID=A0A6A6YZA6_9PEZI|nr:uncharacterized protein BDZ99DRAFT_495771 [Mytilinidion resinicola]KAF2814252.1 hypothetical protein BDZ99DRAFT_495771 [Mytilinidion resinicola]
MPAIRGSQSKKKTRRHTRDLDQIHADLTDGKHLEQYKLAHAVEDLPGLGQWYCTECAKWFEGETNFLGHKKGSTHKRRVKALREEPHTQKAAEAAVGIGTDNGKRTNTTLMEIDGGAAATV